ncbi:DUF669 domain-containing protein [Enterococcus asini]|uniref:DUF669 domain-containing protein n=1 Tax=Enterococcus asini TaxID=57732 RepID=A0AAW8TVV0_9ENTE|nr:DUF669 domain-containing protein [Enterococcus asini]MDT2809164.1 DUF669 domain-containing protein [Enterococcus asini]
MGLLDTLNQLKEEGFDAKKDNISQSSKLEPGTYPVRLKSAQANVSKSGQTQLAITLEVVSGKDKNRLEIIYMSFDEGLPAFVLEKNGRTLLKIAAVSDMEFKKKDLEDEYTAAEALSQVIGSQFKMNLSVSPNKKNPNYPYRNYEFGPLEEQTDNSIDIEDDDLPF